MYTWSAFGSYNGGSKRPQWTRFAAAQKCIFRRPHSKNRDHWTWHNVSWKSPREKLKYESCSSHWVEQLVQSNLFCWSLLWKVTIKVSEILTQNWSFFGAFLLSVGPRKMYFVPPWIGFSEVVWNCRCDFRKRSMCTSKLLAASGWIFD